MNIKKPNSFARYGNDYVAPLTTIDQIVKPSGERYTDREFELMSNVENVMFGENCAGKNLLNPTLQTTTVNGVTCTNNGDGTFTLNGTATDSCEFVLWENPKFNGTLKLVGSPQGLNQNCCLSYSNNTDSSFDDIGNGINVTQFDYLTYPNCAIKFFIYTGITCNNLVFKPMLTEDLNATYNDFEPYVKSLKQLTNNMDLLWTNASPTSAFEGQTIDIDLSIYKLLLIYFKRDINSGENENYFFIGNVDEMFMCLIPRADTYYTNRRLIYRTGNNLSIGDSLLGTTNAKDNNAIIPYKIYGIK